ncbi:MAG: OmpA family protein [Myxococcota bacterium]
MLSPGSRAAVWVLGASALSACASSPSPEPRAPVSASPAAEAPALEPLPELAEVASSPHEVTEATVVAFEERLRGALGTVYFDYNLAIVDQAAKDRLSALADVLRELPEALLEIEGHCDVRGSTEYNLHLGERRARAVLKYLVTQGVPERQLRYISYGEERPVDYGSTDAAHAANRRAELRAP